MRVLVAGASGFLGGAWSRLAADLGHDVRRLVRRTPAGPGEVRWDPTSASSGDALDQREVDAADVVVNLAGASLIHFPWNDAYRRAFLASRVGTTRVLAEAVARSADRSADGSGSPPVLLAQSGVAAYGDRGSTVITEDTPTDADTFMAGVVRDWEAATAPAVEAGARVVTMRTAVVLDRSGGALRTMLLPFRLGLGGRIGSGAQYFATISLPDWLGAVMFLALDDGLSGPVNLSGPDPSTNAEFTRALGRALHRPTVVPVPAAPVRRLAGPIGGEILASQRIEPARLLQAGYAFAHNDIDDRVRAALRPPRHGVTRG